MKLKFKDFMNDFYAQFELIKMLNSKFKVLFCTQN